MWSIVQHIPADAQVFGCGMVLVAALWVVVVLIVAVIALLKTKPEHIADVIEAFSHWWRR